MGEGELLGVALITGAGSGIGKECGLGFAYGGAAGVVFADIDLERAEAAAEESRKLASNPRYEALAMKVDVTSLSMVEGMVSATVAKFGRIDYSINSVGVVPQPGPVPHVSLEDSERLYSVYVKGTLYCVQTVAKVMLAQEPQMIQGRSGLRRGSRGSIVNITSAFSISVTQGQMGYATAKHAVLGLTKTAAMDLTCQGVRVNALLPGFINTPMMQVYSGNEAATQAVQGMVNMWIPLKRMGEPEEVADVALFLAGPRASFVSGAAWTVDGAMTTGLNLAAP